MRNHRRRLRLRGAGCRKPSSTAVRRLPWPELRRSSRPCSSIARRMRWLLPPLSDRPRAMVEARAQGRAMDWERQRALAQPTSSRSWRESRPVRGKPPECQNGICAYDPSLSILDVFLDVFLIVRGFIDRAVAIHRNPDRRLPFRITRNRRRYIGDDLAILGVADADAAFAIGIVVIAGFVVGLGIDHIEHVVAIDIDAAGPAELFPRGEKLAVLVEHHHTAIAAIGNVKVVLTVDGEGMRRSQLPIPRPPGGKGLDELAVLGEFR